MLTIWEDPIKTCGECPYRKTLNEGRSGMHVPYCGRYDRELQIPGDEKPDFCDLLGILLRAGEKG